LPPLADTPVSAWRDSPSCLLLDQPLGWHFVYWLTHAGINQAFGRWKKYLLKVMGFYILIVPFKEKSASGALSFLIFFKPYLGIF
jgi:antibiotic biosynthesis monooxygenase (ABM) superfamily enzyme